MQWLFLALVSAHVVTLLTYAHGASLINEEIERHDYLKCTRQTKFHPGVCDCRGMLKCFIQFIITKNKRDNQTTDETQLFSVNGGRMGPTIIVDHNQLIIVDVYNKIIDPEYPENANISIHWHGMHQWNTAWMDGVGDITQWPTKPGDAFRYVLRANPGGTHWYHSHMLYQRDEGIVGALIVKDIPSKNTQKLLKNVIDDPGETMLAIRDELHVVKKDHKLEATFPRKPSECEPDHSMFPIFNELVGGKTKLKQFRINGVKLSGRINETSKGPTFYVKRGEKYRFRIVGVMTANLIRFSIDKHKLQVISADGYLTKPFKTDIVIIHVGERYDFILETNAQPTNAGTIFPIRIETVAVHCDDYFTPSKIGFAYLQYTNSETAGEPKLVDHYDSSHRCKVNKCTALNCPFGKYPLQANTICHNVKELKLLNPTPPGEVPSNSYPVIERFFNFDFEPGPTINGIDNKLPQNIPFLHSGNEEVQNECPYEHVKTCTACSHSVYLHKSRGSSKTFEPQVVRFVLSSLSKKKPGDRVANVGTHPIHLHGHSYFVAKIAYPTYHANGTISNLNKDVDVLPCEGHGHWRKEKPSNITVFRDTVRKDVIILPAGGYVVIEFLANNPGWWFMHCHIDRHLNNGMAIAVSELPECQNPPENMNYTVKDTYEDSEKRFHQYEKNGDKCGIDNKQHLKLATKETKVRELNHDYEHVPLYYKRLFQRVGAHADTENGKFQDRDKLDQHASEWDALNLARHEQI